MQMGHLNTTSLVAFQACVMVLTAAADTPPSNEQLRELMSQRVTVLEQLAKARMKELVVGKGDPLAAVDTVAQLPDASLEVAATPAERKSTVERQLNAIRTMAAAAKARIQAGVGSSISYRAAEIARLGMEIRAANVGPPAAGNPTRAA